MEPQEEKKRRRRQSKSTLSVPIDLTSEILLRLPDKSLARFRCVSKLWSSIINDPYFINLFETRSPRPRLLFCFRKYDSLVVSSIPPHSKISNKRYSFYHPTDLYHMKLPGNEYYSFTESVHVLICFLEFNDTPIVWNDSKRQFLTLPKPIRMSLRDHIGILLGYNPIEGKHKLVCMSLNRDCDVCQVLIFGSAQESWRMVKTNHKHHSYQYPTHGRCIKRVIYYESYISKTVWVMMSFDVRSEIFDTIELPSDIHKDGEMMMNYEGKLACVREQTMQGYSYGTITLFILEDAKKQERSSKDFISPLKHHDQSFGVNFSLIGITPAGEFIYAPLWFCKLSYILFCDPVKNSCRRIEFKEIGEDGSWRWLYVFPNHIDSQRSL